ncbi:MAG TPA: hypothetical protein VGE40_07505, partial [Bacilli bacterium]
VLIKYGDTNRNGLQNPKEYQAEGTLLAHQIGRADGDGWSANVAQDNLGYLIYGPYATDISTGHRFVKFRMMIDNNTFDNNEVAKLQVYDATAGTILKEVAVLRQKFKSTYTYQDFGMAFDNPVAGHQLEFRIIWNDIAYVKVDKISVDSLSSHTFEAESAPMQHLIGRADGDGWSANVAQDHASYLLYGPYADYITTGSRTAVFRIMIDDNTFDNSNVARIEAYNATSGTMLAQQTITRKQFTSTYAYQDFNLTFNHSTAGNQLEFRIYWHDIAYVKVDKVTVK